MSDKPKPWTEEGRNAAVDAYEPGPARGEMVANRRAAFREGHATGARAARVETLREVVSAYNEPGVSSQAWIVKVSDWQDEVEDAERE